MTFLDNFKFEARIINPHNENRTFVHEFTIDDLF